MEMDVDGHVDFVVFSPLAKKRSEAVAAKSLHESVASLEEIVQDCGALPAFWIPAMRHYRPDLFDSYQ